DSPQTWQRPDHGHALKTLNINPEDAHPILRETAWICPASAPYGTAVKQIQRLEPAMTETCGEAVF
ncbi:MAG TPA: hypothetical protein VMU04_08945, partial [Candidatus Acidoferrum sp.]|nr:hypothetical protein [Candidatus Acidoferrum sp.]